MIVYDIMKNESVVMIDAIAAFNLSDDGKRLVYSCVNYTGIAYEWGICEYDLEEEKIISEFKSTDIIRKIFYKAGSYEIYTVTKGTYDRFFP
ncbi:hypothetical protein LJC58_02590 [Lachnospiraceae bacterium OttesenSCG-928-D06]|nr:hypothetical protein [Lachnospiraceae bacterium OttesenSCG-928-D06]